MILWITRQPAAKPMVDATAGTVTYPAPSAGELAKKDSRRLRRLVKWVAITFATLVALVLIAVAAFFAVFDVDLGKGVGDRDIAVTNVANLQDTLSSSASARSTSISAS